MRKIKHTVYFMIPVSVLLVHLVFHSASGEDSDVSAELQEVRESFRDGLKESLNDEKVRDRFTQKGLKLMKMVLDRSIPDKKIVEKSMTYLRGVYTKNVRKLHHEKGTVEVRKLKQLNGLEVIDLPYTILVLRGEVEPLEEYRELTGRWISVKSIKSFISVMTDEEHPNWKAIWFSPDLLKFHLKRVVDLDERWNFKDRYLIHGEKPDISSLDPLPYPYSIRGISGEEDSSILIGDLVRLKKHYGDREMFKNFVFNYPIYGFSRLHAAEVSGQYSPEKLAKLYIEYAKKLLDRTKRRKDFYRRVSRGMPEKAAHILLQKTEEGND